MDILIPIGYLLDNHMKEAIDTHQTDMGIEFTRLEHIPHMLVMLHLLCTIYCFLQSDVTLVFALHAA